MTEIDGPATAATGAEAAAPTNTTPTVPDQPPPITDTQADPAAATPPPITDTRADPAAPAPPPNLAGAGPSGGGPGGGPSGGGPGGGPSGGGHDGGPSGGGHDGRPSSGGHAAGSAYVPPMRTPEEAADERLKSAPVDPWATEEAAALAAGHLAPVSFPPTPSSPSPVTPSSSPAVTPSSLPAVTPSSLPAVTPSSLPAVTPSSLPAVTPSSPPFGAQQSPAGWAPPGAARPVSPPYGQPSAGPVSGHPANAPFHPQPDGPVAPGSPYPQHSGPVSGQPYQVRTDGQGVGPGHAGQPGGWGRGATTPEAARKSRVLGKRSYVWIVATAVTIALAGGITWYFWPGDPALDYQPLSEPRRITPIVPISSDWSDAEILDGRAYFASSDATSGNVGVVAIGVGETKPVWTSMKAGQADRWKTMIALPEGVALISEQQGTDSTRRLAVLGAKDGSLLWSRTLSSNDVVLFAGSTAVIADRKGKQLVGVRISDGAQRWALPDPKSAYSGDTNVVAVTTPKDLDGPATAFGRPFEPDFDDDPRIVQIGVDKSARVIDADSGKILTSRYNVADPDAEVVAHNGRLIVLQPDNQQIVSYDLKKLGEPKVLYTTQAQNSQMKDVTPCGDDRVCFDEQVGYDSKSATVVALDVAGGKQLWRYPLADTETIVPVGEAVLVSTASDLTLLDAKGAKIWTHTGEAARLDDGNLLEFSKPLTRSPEETALYGRHLGDEAVPLGSFDDIRADTCGWDKAMLACVGDKDFELMRFAK